MRTAFAISLFLSACQGDETLAAYGASDTIWQLESIDGTPFQARATISFPEKGVIRGRAPCNSFGAQQTVPYPWFKIENIRQTRATCPEQSAENRFLLALRAMTLSEVGPGSLILSNDDGRQMIFVPASD